MIWKGTAFCLFSESVMGHTTDLKEVAKSKIHGEIIVADRLSIENIYSIIERKKIRAIVLRNGSLADHIAVLLNGLGIQLAIASELPEIDTGTPMLILGDTEIIYVAKTMESLRDYLKSQRGSTDIYARESDKYHLCESVTYLSNPVSVHVDGKNAEELFFGVQNGADGIGILRTEWLQWSSKKSPDEKTHYAIYEKCADKVYPLKLNIRLFDLGGDKIPYWAQSVSEFLISPLGQRGIRAMNLLSEAFLNQIRAICNLANDRDVGIVLPMVADASQIKTFKDMLYKIASSKAKRHISLGAMIEVPAAAIKIKDILSEVDFVRIGPGDLTQFCLAKLRCNLSPLELSGSSIHPAVLFLIKKVANECGNFDKQLSICLDLEPRVPILQDLLRLGVCIFDVSPKNVQITKTRLKEISGSIENKKY